MGVNVISVVVVEALISQRVSTLDEDSSRDYLMYRAVYASAMELLLSWLKASKSHLLTFTPDVSMKRYVSALRVPHKICPSDCYVHLLVDLPRIRHEFGHVIGDAQ